MKSLGATHAHGRAGRSRRSGWYSAAELERAPQLYGGPDHAVTIEALLTARSASSGGTLSNLIKRV
jgi:hypothetical protein